MLKVVITGIANSGKTTLFNTLTKSDERVGNWHGVTTTEAKKQIYKKGIGKVEFCDLPGSYFLDDYTLESKSVFNPLLNCSLAVVVSEAVNLKKGLILVNIIKSMGVKCLLVVNFNKEFERAGGKIDYKLLSEKIGCPVVRAECNDKKQTSKIFKLIKECESTLFNFNPFNEQEVLSRCYFYSFKKVNSSFLDKILLSPFYCVLLIATTFICFLYLAFGKYGLGNMLEWLIEKVYVCAIIKPITHFLVGVKASELISRLILEGILQGVLAVIVFLPRLVIVSLYNCILQESGFLSRIAFCLNDIFKKCGLTGRSIFALLSAYGCTVSAVYCCNGLESESAKNRLIGALSFVSCSAKTPVYLYILNLMGAKYGFLVIPLFYVIGFVFALLCCFVSSRFKKSKAEHLIIEFPPYRLASFKSVKKALQKFAKGFIIKVGTIILLSTAFLWFLKSFSLNLTLLYPEQVDKSILASLSKSLTKFFAPIGLGDYKIIVALISGLLAKESVISALCLLGVTNLSFLTGTVLLIYVFLYPPCVSALSAVCSVRGVKGGVKVFCLHFILAYLVALAVNCPNLFGIFIVLIICLAVFYRLKSKLKGDACKVSACARCSKCKNTFHKSNKN